MTDRDWTTSDAAARRRAEVRARREAKRIDISGPLRELTELLGETYGLTAEFRITPDEVVVVVFAPNADGKPHINRETGYAVMEQHRYDVRT